MTTLRQYKLTLSLTLISVIVFFFESATGALELNRAAFETGQTWRIFTGHFTHWNIEHLAWDLLMFIALSASLEKLAPQRLLPLLLLQCITISLGMLLLENYASYRGLSGLDSGLFMFLCLHIANLCRHFKKRTLSLYAYSAILLFFGKSAFECLSGQAIFVYDMGARVEAAPLAHLLGALGALTYFTWIRFFKTTTTTTLETIRA